MGSNNFDLKKIIRDYFTFSKDERRAAMAIMTIIAALLIFPGIYQYLFAPTVEKADQVLISEVKTLVALQNSHAPKTNNYGSSKNKYAYAKAPEAANLNKLTLFPFDPNTADQATWMRLGLPQKTIQTIQNYLNKGGKFRKPEDLTKIYGLSQQWSERLLPYVKFSDKKTLNQKDSGDNRKPPGLATYNNKLKDSPKEKLFLIDINTADSSVFEKLPGIGNKLSARIINYRQKLGGFYQLQQISETYGLPDSIFQLIKTRLTINQPVLKKLNINLANAQELKHPYLTWKMANAIVAYRKQHGTFSTVKDLTQLVLMDEASFKKIEPYLIVE